MASKVVRSHVHQPGVETQAWSWRQVGSEPAKAASGAETPPPESPAPARNDQQQALELALAEANVRVQAAKAQGMKEGLAQGLTEGEKRVRAEVTPLMERLARTIADLSETRDAFRKEAEEDVVRLSLGVARRILHREVSIDPDALTGIIRVALSKFEARELHRVLVSVEDHPAVATALQSLKLPRAVQVVADPTLERGAALFETVKGTLDASVDTQLDEIERGLLDVLGQQGRRG